MNHALATSRRPNLRLEAEPAQILPEVLPDAPWLAVVSDSVKSIRYGVVQIVIHDSRVVQVERTERTRFDLSPSAGRR